MKWHVTASNGRTGKRIGETWVEAADSISARSVGVRVLKLIGVKLGRLPQVVARRYHPDRDPAFAGYIRLEEKIV